MVPITYFIQILEGEFKKNSTFKYHIESDATVQLLSQGDTYLVGFAQLSK